MGKETLQSGLGDGVEWTKEKNVRKHKLKLNFSSETVKQQG